MYVQVHYDEKNGGALQLKLSHFWGWLHWRFMLQMDASNGNDDKTCVAPLVLIKIIFVDVFFQNENKIK